MKPLIRAILLVAIALVSTIAVGAPPSADAAAKAPADVATATRGAEKMAGFFDVYRDGAKGRVLLGVRTFDTPFLLVTSLPWGLGSNDIGLDRGQSGESHLVEFRRAGARVLLVEDNTKFRAVSSNPDEAQSVREAFAESVLWAGDVVGERKGADAESIVDLSSLLTSDRHGIARRLADAKQGKYELDDKRSAVSLADAKSFPDNTELEGMLTFKGPGDQQFVKDVAMDPQTITLRQHLSFVRLPGPGYASRAYHPASGAFSVGYYDFAQPLAGSLDVRFQPRFRLEKIDPSAAQSPVKKPIVFYIDRGAPEPMRAALLEGVNWWKQRVRKAGFKDAYRVELLPEGADPMDIRYNVDHCGRPRHARLVLRPADRRSAHRRDHQGLGPARLAARAPGHAHHRRPGRADDKTERARSPNEAVQMALARLRQLAAHEVGHALGFAHNFAASRRGNGSVMDYPHPLLKLDADGRDRARSRLWRRRRTVG